MTQDITIFGYGSLINLDSLKKDVPEFSNVRIATLHGYKRFFGKKAGRSFTANGQPISVLDIKESKGGIVNGICFDVPSRFYDNLLKREKAYNFKEVDIKIEATNKSQKALVAVHKDKKEYPFVAEEPMQEWYLKLCLNGAKNHGDSFYGTFLRTTYIGDILLSDIRSNEP